MPEPPSGYSTPLPDRRPTGLRRRRISAGTDLWRIDADDPKMWSWDAFGEPRHRFDPASGGFRTRYAGRTLVGAARERYRATGLYIPADHGDHHVVRLTARRPMSVLDLRTEQNLDVLDVDDQISTGLHPAVWRTCHQLADATKRWWDDLDAIVYRSRTTPATSFNVAFFSSRPFAVESWPLADREDLVVDLVLRHDFTVGWDLADRSPGKPR